MKPNFKNILHIT